MVRHKATYRQSKSGGFATCWYCDRKTNGILEFIKSGEQVFACLKCALKYAKFKGLHKTTLNRLGNKKSLKISDNNKGKTTQMTLVLEGKR